MSILVHHPKLYYVQVVGVQSASAKEDEFVSCDEGGTVCFWSTDTKKEPEVSCCELLLLKFVDVHWYRVLRPF